MQVLAQHAFLANLMQAAAALGLRESSTAIRE
jgi:hypothetical protein